MSGAQPRLASLDAFRGFTIAAMMLVNNPGDWNAVYAPLRHAEWNGCTPTDLVFPFFLFIAGVALALATASARDFDLERW
jgi:predicted acyltransferase